MTAFLGFDHIDCRVNDLAAVESFYDAFLPALGLTEKRYAFVDASGEWHDAAADGPYNTVEYIEPGRGEAPWRHFIGFIHDPGHRPGNTRIAFRVPRSELENVAHAAVRAGARGLEWSEDMTSYPAVFFEDAAGTKLELIGRR